MIDHKVLSPHTRRGQLTYQGYHLMCSFDYFFPLSFTTPLACLSHSLSFPPSLFSHYVFSICHLFILSFSPSFLSLLALNIYCPCLSGFHFSILSLAFVASCEMQGDRIQKLRKLLICVMYDIMGNVIL